MNAKSLDDDYFIKNAIMCWLHYYGDKNHKWDAIYKELAQRETFTVKPKPRPARRAKKTNTEGV
jgi:hypothetical protein